MSDNEGLSRDGLTRTFFADADAGGADFMISAAGSVEMDGYANVALQILKSNNLLFEVMMVGDGIQDAKIENAIVFLPAGRHVFTARLQAPSGNQFWPRNDLSASVHPADLSKTSLKGQGAIKASFSSKLGRSLNLEAGYACDPTGSAEVYCDISLVLDDHVIGPNDTPRYAPTITGQTLIIAPGSTSKVEVRVSNRNAVPRLSYLSLQK